jgi:polyisoprenoid-binding protein YceI
MAWKVDPDRSQFEFLVGHWFITTLRGSFAKFEGTLHMDEENPQASSVEGRVDVRTLDTGIGMRTRNVKSHFDVADHPYMTFRSTGVGPFEGDRFKVYGDLTIKGITRPVVFDIVNRGELPAQGGQRRWSFEATTTFNRKDFDIKWWFPLMDIGVGEEIRPEIKVEFVQE